MTAVRFDSLDLDQVGRSLGGIVCASFHVRHKRVRYTLRDYVRPDTPELEFLRDAFLLSNDELIEKWFNGDRLEACSRVDVGL